MDSVTVPRIVMRGAWASHKVLHRLTGGRLSTNLPTDTRPGTLFLVTTGRRTGQQRRSGLNFIVDGDALVVVPSNAGADVDPGWWVNLRADPDAVVEIGTEHRAVRGRTATPEEATRLWPRLEAVYPPYATYRTQTSRAIVPVILEPRTSPSVDPG